MAFIFLESDLNVLKALNKKKNKKKKLAPKNLVFSWGNEEDIVFCTHSVWLTCVFPSCGILVFFQNLKQTLKPESVSQDSVLRW